MKTIVSLFFFATLAVAEAPSYMLQASFSDGTRLEIFTQSTGSAPVSPQGEMGIGPGVGSQDLVNRIVIDGTGNILFAYNLEASRGASPGTIKIRIEPISAATEAGILKEATRPGRPRFSGAHLPTVAAARDFPAVAVGQAVTLDILYNPSTGEKIYDVLRPLPNSTPAAMSVTSVAATPTISLRGVTVRVNGSTLPASATWVIGTAVRIDIPRSGSYIISAAEPPAADTSHAFTKIAQAAGKTLSWTLGADHVEIASETNVLSGQEKATLWLFHDPHYQPDVVSLQSADAVDWLFPKR